MKNCLNIYNETLLSQGSLTDTEIRQGKNMGYREKKRVMEKLRVFHKNVKKNGGHIGRSPRIIDLSYDNACNFHCKHCFTQAPEGINVREHMPFELIKKLMDEADELGFYELDLQGGELLTDPERFFALVEAAGADRFYLYLTTNGYYLSRKMARRLAEAGIDRVSVSVDGMDAKAHDAFRGKEGAYDHAVRALKYVKEEGIGAFMNITAGHYNAFSDELEAQLKFCHENGFHPLLNAAVPAGCWKNNYDVMLDPQDTAHIQQLRRKYPDMIRDLWDPFDTEREKLLGCNAGNILYITPWGDVLPCPFIHIKLGNIYRQSLREIMDVAFSIPHFSEFSDKCLAGEDVEFVSKYLNGSLSVRNPADAHSLFGEEIKNAGNINL